MRWGIDPFDADDARRAAARRLLTAASDGSRLIVLSPAGETWRCGSWVDDDVTGRAWANSVCSLAPKRYSNSAAVPSYWKYDREYDDDAAWARIERQNAGKWQKAAAPTSSAVDTDPNDDDEGDDDAEALDGFADAPTVYEVVEMDGDDDTAEQSSYRVVLCGRHVRDLEETEPTILIWRDKPGATTLPCEDCLRERAPRAILGT